ncbi:MAG: V-type ATP synthase subunit B [Oscillospiraceae bacterium]|nr:V-type ATP synthase subunit B [Oscillospiraceae bacterium]
MSLEYKGFSEIKGSLVSIENVKKVSFDEVVEITLPDGEIRIGRVVEILNDKAIIQVFAGTDNFSLENTYSKFKGKPLEFAVSKELLGRIFNGMGKPIDNLGNINYKKSLDINGYPINPMSRKYPVDYINTGISAIDGLATLIRGQKLPIFSGSGMNHNKLAVQIVNQAKIAEKNNQQFGIIFAAMGIKNDVSDYFIKSFKHSGVINNVVMFLNLSNDPIIERIITPRIALTAAEYLAFEEDMHILVILTDMTAYAEAVREFSSSKGEIPGRKGYPGYLYSDLASIYERAGMIKGRTGSITQIPILTMPNDDITHPIPDLTGYITEGQIVLERTLDKKGIYPPISILPSLSRIMKDGIGKGFTREDHPDLANQLFASYSKVMEVIALASVIGEDELSDSDKLYMKFGNLFEQNFISQKENENRSIEQTLEIGWKILSILPKEDLDRIDYNIIEKYYKKEV